jgi:hypothetical protein
MASEFSGMIFDGQEGSLLAADAHHHRSSTALMGAIHPGDRQSSAMMHNEKCPRRFPGRAVQMSENHGLPERSVNCIS